MMNFFSSYKEDEFQYAMNDFIIAPDMCNFRCDYCIFDEAPQQRKSGLLTGKTQIKTVYDKDGDNIEFYQKTGEVLKKHNLAFRTPILRICGGELFYLKDTLSFLEKIHNNYETVQIISNGYFLNEEKLHKIKDMKNCILHISLDGHTQELNSRRLKSVKMHEVLMNNILKVIDLKIPLEIASCLTDNNTAEFEKVIQFFSERGGDVLLLPFPVRGDECIPYFPSEEAKMRFSEILDRYENYQNVLPPKKYFESIVSFYQQGRKLKQCHIPKVIVQTFHNGDVCACCMDWSVKIGNVMEKSITGIRDAIAQNKMIQMYSIKPPRLKSCRTCFTVSEIINLYFNDEITVNELRSMRLFGGDRTVKVLEEIKNRNKNYERNKKNN